MKKITQAVVRVAKALAETAIVLVILPPVAAICIFVLLAPIPNRPPRVDAFPRWWGFSAD